MKATPISAMQYCSDNFFGKCVRANIFQRDEYYSTKEKQIHISYVGTFKGFLDDSHVILEESYRLDANEEYSWKFYSSVRIVKYDTLELPGKEIEHIYSQKKVKKYV